MKAKKTEEEKDKYYAPSRWNCNRKNCSWTAWERAELLRTNITDKELSKQLGRSIEVIQA